MIPIYQCIYAASQQILSSSFISNYCLTNYNKQIKVYIGEDVSNPPTEFDAPFVVLTPPLPAYDVGEGTFERRPGFEMDWGVVAEKRVSNDTSTLISYPGIQQSDELGMLLVAEMMDCFESGALQTANYSLDSGTRYPLFEGGVSIQLIFWNGLAFEPEVSGSI